MARARRSGGGFGRILLGFVLGAVAVGGAGLAYFKWKRTAVPVPAVDRSSSIRKHGPIAAPSARPEGEKKPPFGISEDVFEAGAHVYAARCASCHGTPGHDAAFARTVHPSPSQLWSNHGRAVAVRSPGAIYAQVANGIAGSGMPAYEHVLPEPAIWQVSLLLANAERPLRQPSSQR